MNKEISEKEIQKRCAKHNKETWKIVLLIILLIIGMGGIIYAGVMQMILCYQKFGIIIDPKHLIIPHLSLLGYLGIIPLSIVRLFII